MVELLLRQLEAANLLLVSTAGLTLPLLPLANLLLVSTAGLTLPLPEPEP